MSDSITNVEPTPRAITNFEVSPTSLEVWAVDGPGSGGANHCYEISGYSAPDLPEGSCYTSIHFQDGPIGETGPNGITCGSLIAICIDRLEAFQRGPYASEHNAAALSHLQSAIGCLFDRTRARMARGVEGTSAL